MIKAIPMEDWLRGCVYHDGRHGEVTLSTDNVLKIANYIQRTRRSVLDGLIDLEVPDPKIVGKHADQIIVDEVVSEPNCDNCANKGDHNGKCRNCVSTNEKIIYGTPSHYEPATEEGSMVDPLHDDCFDCDKFFTCDNKGDDYKTDCPWK